MNTYIILALVFMTIWMVLGARGYMIWHKTLTIDYGRSNPWSPSWLLAKGFALLLFMVVIGGLWIVVALTEYERSRHER